jgi:hypothetical protein
VLHSAINKLLANNVIYGVTEKKAQKNRSIMSGLV